jgi:hypothetical protein
MFRGHRPQLSGGLASSHRATTITMRSRGATASRRRTLFMTMDASLFRTDLSGLWQRVQVHEPDAADQPVLQPELGWVRRLQVGPWFAQWQLPAARATVRALALSALSPAEWAVLATQQAQLGRVQIESHPEGEVCQWLPRQDFQPPSRQVEAGWLMFDAPHRLLEIDTQRDRTQVWVGDADAAWTSADGDVWARAGVDSAGADDGRVLLAAGPWRVYARPRAQRWPRGMRPGFTLSDVLLHQPELAVSWLDHELSLARDDGGRCRVVQSTLPERVGQDLGVDDEAGSAWRTLTPEEPLPGQA